MAAELIFNADTQALFGQAVQIMFAAMLNSEKERLVIALPGGRSIVGLLQAMAERTDGIPDELWRRLHFFSVDERLVPSSAPENNFRLLNEVFFHQALQSGLLSADQIHPFIIDNSSVDQELERYGCLLQSFGGAFDITFLGVGEDGHIAGLFPQHRHLSDLSAGFLALNDAPKPPAGRMTASPRLIAASGIAFALFIGEGKRQALRLYSDAKVPVETCPVKLVDLVGVAYAITDISPGENVDYFAKRL